MGAGWVWQADGGSSAGQGLGSAAFCDRDTLPSWLPGLYHTAATVACRDGNGATSLLCSALPVVLMGCLSPTILIGPTPHPTPEYPLLSCHLLAGALLL